MSKLIIFLSLFFIVFFSGCSTKQKPKKSPCIVRNFNYQSLSTYLVKDSKMRKDELREKNFFGNDIVDCADL